MGAGQNGRSKLTPLYIGLQLFDAGIDAIDETRRANEDRERVWDGREGRLFGTVQRLNDKELKDDEEEK